MIESNYVSELTFAGVDSKAGFEKAKQSGSKGIIDEITASGLRGCGGAGFPTGLKLTFMTKEQADPKYVICNADEGEPGTFKDREILTNHPEVVFTGMAIAGNAISAQKGIFYIRAEYEYMKKHLEEAIAKCKEFTGFDIEIRSGAGAYVCGEETALIESLEGKRGEPRNRPPFPIQNGYLGKPSEVNNVETFAWMTTIMTKGAKWFKDAGTEQSPGYKIFSISGDCNRPGVYEFPMGTTINEMLKAVDGMGAKAVQMGGASGQTVPASQFDRKIAFEDAPPGGSIMVFGPKRNMLDVAENFLEFFVEESCGQCTPCRKGNVQLLEAVRKMKAGKCCGADCECLDKLYSLAETMRLASKCGLGQTSSNAFVAITEHFADEIKCGGKK